MSQLGRISGQLLKDNLTRNGHDLTFDNDLLHLDVTNRRIGIKTVTPQHDLDVNGVTRTTDLEVTNRVDISVDDTVTPTTGITIAGDTITSNTGILNLTNGAGNQINYQAKLVVDNVELENNVISTNGISTNLELRPNGSGTVDIYADTNVYGDVYVTGNIRADGNITVGDANTDNITINADVASNIIPDVDVTYQLGNGGTGYTEGVEFTLGDVVLTVSSIGSIVTIAIPAAGPSWVNTLTTHTVGKSYQITLYGQSGIYSLVTLGSWTGTNPQTVTTTNDGLADGVYSVESIRFDQKRWLDLWVNNIYTDAIVSGEIEVDGINLTTVQGNLYYVAANGSDTNVGRHQNDPFATITHAISQAVAGDTIYVYPGRYEETFPLAIPAGVVLHGSGIRSVFIYPTASTMYLNAVELTGETTVEDCTFGNFYHDPVAGTGHAFAFQPGGKITTRSPYIRNVSVITKGTASVLSVNSIKTEVIDTINRIKTLLPLLVTNSAITKTPSNPLNAVLGPIPSDGATGTLLQGLTDNVTYIINNGTEKINLPSIVANSTAATTGMLVNAASILTLNKEFIKEEAYAYITTTYAPTIFDPVAIKRDISTVVDGMIYDIVRGGNEHTVYAGLSYWTHPTNDPRGYARADAGPGVDADGSVLDPTSNEAGMLFSSVTLIVPGSDALTATAGARIEWLNSFTYYANRSMYLYSSPAGFAGVGKTRIKINNTTGTWAVNDTLFYYDTDGVTVLASGVIESIDGAFYNIDGYELGFETPEDRPQKIVTVHGNAQLSTAEKKFGPSSLALDGTGDYLKVASQPDFGFGTDDFTIEFWVYRNNAALTEGFLDFKTTNPQVTPNIYAVGSNLYYFTNGSVRITGTAAIPLANTWYHIAVSRVSGNTRMFVNGAQVGSTYADANNYITTQLVIGNNYVYTAGLNGYMDDLRISKGLGRYTSGGFTAPTTALTGDNNTVLLLHFNGTNGSTAIADNGVTLQDLRTSSGGTANLIDFADYSDFGVEIRSIGSASVYGEYGIYGDGDGVIAYLIGHNFAYIGNGSAATNDPNSVIQANEIVELNNAHIYFQSIDHKGDFRVGDLFYVNQSTGEVSFSNANVTIGTTLTFDDGLGNVTYLDATKIETGDFRISNNTIETLTQDFIIDAASNQVNLQSNVTITGNLDVTGNVTVGGNVTIGNESTDTVQFVAGVDSDILPALPSTYDLGTPTERWSTLYSTTLVNANVQISTNVITTTASNIDLTLQANGTGRIYVPANNVEITNNLTVNGTTDVQDLNVTGTLTHIGDVTQTGNVNQTGDIDLIGTFTTTDYAQFADIKIDNNTISTTIGTNDLILDAAGTGRIYVPDSDVEITQDLTVTGFIDVGSLTVDTTISSLTLTAGDIKLESNFITTLTGNNNLELRANGTGLIYVPSNNVQIDNNLTVVGTTNLAITNIGVVGTPATVTHVGTITQTGDLFQTGNTEITGTLTVGSTAQFEDIQIDNNIITTTIGNNNLILQAAGTGKVIVPNDNAEVTGTLNVVGTTSTTTVNNTGTVTSDTFSTGNITIASNIIQTTTLNSNLQLQAAGTGFIEVEQFDVQENELRINSGTDMIIAPNGTGIVNVNSTQSIKIPVGDTASRPLTPASGMIRFNTSLTRYEGYIGTAWTRLDGVEDSDGNTKITAELTPGANDNTIRFYANGVEVADLTSTRLNTINVDIGQININSNIISTTVTNTDLVLSPNGAGTVRIGNFSISSNVFVNTVNNSITSISQTGDGYVKINSTGGFVIPVGRTDQRPSIFEVGMMRYNTTDERVEVWNSTAWVGVAQGAQSGITAEEATDISILSAFIFG